jgi:hypothetical protein
MKYIIFGILKSYFAHFPITASKEMLSHFSIITVLPGDHKTTRWIKKKPPG